MKATKKQSLFCNIPKYCLTLLCLVMQLATYSYEIQENPVTIRSYPDPPVIPVGESVIMNLGGGKRLIFGPDDEYTLGNCGYGFEWMACMGIHDHFHNRVPCEKENSYYCQVKMDDSPWRDWGMGDGTFTSAMDNPRNNPLTALPGHHTGYYKYHYCYCVHPIDKPGPQGCIPIRYTVEGSINFTVVKVDRLTCGNIVSTTHMPGPNESIAVFRGEPLTIKATPYPIGAWPQGQPVWEGDILSSSGDTCVVNTNSPGLKTISAVCGLSRVAIRVMIAEVNTLSVRRSGTQYDFQPSVPIAAGGKDSFVHQADIRIGVGAYGYTGPVKLRCLTSLSGANASDGTDVKASLSIPGCSERLVGNGQKTLDITTTATNGYITGTLTSSNVTRACLLTMDSQSACVNFRWDTSGSRNFDYPEYFIPGQADDIFFYPTLYETADEDLNQNGIIGEGAIPGHNIKFIAAIMTVQYWIYDWEYEDYIDFNTETIAIPQNEDPEICFGVKVSNLIDISNTTETAAGIYKNSQTVYDFYDYNDQYDYGIEVLSYTFDAYDLDVFNE